MLEIEHVAADFRVLRVLHFSLLGLCSADELARVFYHKLAALEWLRRNHAAPFVAKVGYLNDQKGAF